MKSRFTQSDLNAFRALSGLIMKGISARRHSHSQLDGTKTLLIQDLEIERPVIEIGRVLSGAHRHVSRPGTMRGGHHS
jgi:hypothetical protein